MAMNPVDGDLAGAYKRHGGPIKAWKHFGKSRFNKAKDKGSDMVDYFKNKMKEKGTVRYDRSEYLKNAASKGSDKGVAMKAKGMKKAASAGASKAIRGKMNDTRMKRTAPLQAKKNMPLKSIEGKLKKAKLKEKKAPRAKTRYAMAKAKRKA